MQLFQRLSDEYEQVVFCHDEPTGLHAIISIHSTVLGPSLGGTRFYPYSNEDAALEDVLRLSRGMTYKSSAAGLDLGGGKAVIIGDPTTDKTPELLRTYGRFVDSLSGRYITAEDVGTSTLDMDIIQQETSYVTGVHPDNGGSGDPSPVTAWGVFNAMRAVGTQLWNNDDLANKHVVINGVGHVGSALVQYLCENGAKVTIADINDAAIKTLVDAYDVDVVDPDVAHRIECDIFAPCALGGALSVITVPELRCDAVCGAANNQLAEVGIDEVIASRDILYAPDFIVNAGGVINIAEELQGYNAERAMARVAGIYETTLKVFGLAADTNVTTARAADALAESRISAAPQTDRIRRFEK